MPVQVKLGCYDTYQEYGLDLLEIHLNKIQKAGLQEKVNDTGLILIADDQFVNRQAIRLVVEDLGIKERSRIFENGQ